MRRPALGGPKRCLVASPYEADTRLDSEDRGRLIAPRQAVAHTDSAVRKRAVNAGGLTVGLTMRSGRGRSINGKFIP
jgi:hypothetical protein